MAYQPSAYDPNLSRYNQPAAAAPADFNAISAEWKKYLKKLLDGELGTPQAPGAMTPYGSFGPNILDKQNPQRIMYQRQPDYAFAPFFENPDSYRQQVLAQSAHVPVDPISGTPQPLGAYNLFTPQTQFTSEGGANNQTQSAAAAARRVALNATAEQLKSEEFRRTLQALMMEGGLIPIDPNNWRP